MEHCGGRRGEVPADLVEDVLLGVPRVGERQGLGRTHMLFHGVDRADLERQLADAFYYSSVDVDPEKEEAAYRRVLAINPDNTVAVNNLSMGSYASVRE